MLDLSKYTLVGLDTETHLIGKGAVAPDVICASLSFVEADGGFTNYLLSRKHDEAYRQILLDLFNDPQVHLFIHNAKFDLTSITKDDPELMHAAWKAVTEDRIFCTQIAEKLMNLTEHGSLTVLNETPLLYDLVTLEKNYFNRDRSEDKKEDSWRTNYAELEHLPIEAWPQEAVAYAEEDAEGHLRVGLAQLDRASCIEPKIGIDPLKLIYMQTRADFALNLMNLEGSRIDPDKLIEITEEFDKLYNDPRLVQPLVDAGLVIPAVGETPCFTVKHDKSCPGHRSNPEFVKGTKVNCQCEISYTLQHEPGCSKKKGCGCPVKMKKATTEQYKQGPMMDYIWSLAKARPDDFEVWLSDTSVENLQKGEWAELGLTYDVMCVKGTNKVKPEYVADNPRPSPPGRKRLNVTYDKGWRDEFSHRDDLLSIYAERENYKKIITSYIKALYWDGEPADRIHAGYDVLKETGRVSSKSSKVKGSKTELLYPSWNGQQVDPRIRPVIIPDEGYILFSTDYNGMELVTLAQQCYSMFGHSVLREVINSGRDAHSFLGVQIAKAIDPEFKEMITTIIPSGNKFEEHDFFVSFKKFVEECSLTLFKESFFKKYPGKAEEGHTVTWSDFYDYYRTFAKPTGLGYPGLLGIATFIAFAKSPYQVIVDEDTARLLKEVWLETFPEMEEYLNHVKRAFDMNHSSDFEEDPLTGELKERKYYSYTTPLGMHRAKCTACACANGIGLQSPGAEGAKLAVTEIQRRIFSDPTSSLYRLNGTGNEVRLQIFIHDEVFGQIKDTPRLHTQLAEIEEIMVAEMTKITKDTNAGVESCLMGSFWDKYAKPKHDDNGKLIPSN